MLKEIDKMKEVFVPEKTLPFQYVRQVLMWIHLLPPEEKSNQWKWKSTMTHLYAVHSVIVLMGTWIGSVCFIAKYVRSDMESTLFAVLQVAAVTNGINMQLSFIIRNKFKALIDKFHIVYRLRKWRKKNRGSKQTCIKSFANVFIQMSITSRCFIWWLKPIDEMKKSRKFYLFARCGVILLVQLYLLRICQLFTCTTGISKWKTFICHIIKCTRRFVYPSNTFHLSYKWT